MPIRGGFNGAVPIRARRHFASCHDFDCPTRNETGNCRSEFTSAPRLICPQSRRWNTVILINGCCCGRISLPPSGVIASKMNMNFCKKAGLLATKQIQIVEKAKPYVNASLFEDLGARFVTVSYKGPSKFSSRWTKPCPIHRQL